MAGLSKSRRRERSAQALDLIGFFSPSLPRPASPQHPSTITVAVLVGVASLCVGICGPGVTERQWVSA